jgi:hypothetical protein
MALWLQVSLSPFSPLLAAGSVAALHSQAFSPLSTDNG